MPQSDDLSRRERQIMEIVYARAREGATAEQVVDELPDPPTRTAVRTFLRLLEDRGLLRHEKRGRAFVYKPTQRPQNVGKSAFRRVIETFFGGSLEKALSAHLADNAGGLSDEEIQRIEKLIQEAKHKG